MDREELGRRLMASFLGEAEDRIDALNEDLLVLERDDESARRAAVQRLFRSSHSLKGAARAVGIASIETLCHRMEELLAGVRDGARALDAELAELFFRTVDACLVTESGFQTIVEMNPQVGRRLRVLASSPRIVPFVTCFHSDFRRVPPLMCRM